LGAAAKLQCWPAMDRSMSDRPALHVDHAGGVATLTLDGPQDHNAFDDHLIAELTAALEATGDDTAVRATVLTGAGKTLSAGADLDWMRGMAAASEADNLADSLRLARLMRTLAFRPKPTIARVNGSAYGVGVGLVTCCDIAIGVAPAKFCLAE